MKIQEEIPGTSKREAAEAGEQGVHSRLRTPE